MLNLTLQGPSRSLLPQTAVASPGYGSLVKGMAFLPSHSIQF